MIQKCTATANSNSFKTMFEPFILNGTLQPNQSKPKWGKIFKESLQFFDFLITIVTKKGNNVRASKGLVIQHIKFLL